MANTIKIKNSGTASNVPSQLVAGEIAVNYADGKVYYGNASNGVNAFSSTINGTTIAVGGSGTVTANSQTLTGVGSNGTVLTSNGTATVWTSNTGTGNVVRDTSPTLTNVRINSSGGSSPLVIGNVDSVNEGGEIVLITSNANAYANVTLDSYQGTFRVLTGNPVVATFIVSNTGTTVGTVNSGTWQGSAIGSIYGGTGQTTYATGDILYASAANTVGKLTVGTNGQVLASNGTSPVWTANTGTGNIVRDTSPSFTTSITTGSNTFSLINTTATTVNFAGAASTLNMGVAGGTTTISGAVSVGTTLTTGGFVKSSGRFDADDSLSFWIARNNAGTVLFRASVASTVYADTITGRAVQINSAGTMGTTTSTIRNKTDVSDYTFDTEAVLAIQPVRFKYKTELFSSEEDTDNNWQYGFIAEQALEAGVPELVGIDENGLPDYFAYERLCVAQQQVIRELWSKVEVLENEVSVLKQG